MRNTFHYTPPSFKQNTTYAIMLAVICWFVYGTGTEWWQEFTATNTLYETLVTHGFYYYMTVFWAVGIPYLLLDKYKKPRALYRFKVQTNPRRERNNKHSKKLPKTIGVVLRNQLMGTLPATYLLYEYLMLTGYDWTQEIPALPTLLLQLGLLLLVEELLFFSVHWLMHKKTFYKKYHRIHHEYAESIGIATHYVHYVEHIVGNLLPVFAGLMLFHVHMVSFFIWATFAIVNSIHSHSGYNFPWANSTMYHEFHHYNFTGNYGLLGFMDKLCGTDKDYLKMIEEQTHDEGGDERYKSVS